MSQGYRLGLDVGTNSIGWCVIDLDNRGEHCGLRDLGVRIFPDGRDPQSKASLAADRRVARSMRRRRDRYLRRRSDLMEALVRYGLMPADPGDRKALEGLDPYAVRAKALDEKVPLHHLGRALFHLHQRRGFKSNRKIDKSDEKESGKIRSAANRLKSMIADESSRTLGEFLAHRHERREWVRARLAGEGAKAEYVFYPTRDLIEHEFDALWAAQARHHPDLTEDARDAIKRVFFRQRPLRPVDPGRCTFEPTEPRAPWALPLSQHRRIYETLGNLEIVRPDLSARPLSLDERDRLAAALAKKKEMTFEQVRRLLRLDSDHRFNLESERRDKLKGDETAMVLAHKRRFGAAWHEIPFERQNGIVERLLGNEDDSAILAWLRDDCGIGADAAQAVATAPLPSGYTRLGRTAQQRLLDAMQRETREFVDTSTGEVVAAPVTYDKAAAAAGYHHSDHRPDARLERLPYYGEVLQAHVTGSGDPADPLELRWGRVANPTVHVGLNQVRRLINALVAEHGHPVQIVVELARELKIGPFREREIEREQAENQKKNDARREILGAMGLPDNGENRLRLRLYEELQPMGKLCVYTGKPISQRMLFDGSVDIDHILPFSRTLDNSVANRILCLREANRAKTNASPFEAFGHTAAWPDIVARADALPANKRWRFAPDAMQKFEGERGFIDRQLTDTAYLARIAKAYLGHICDPNQVYVVPGRLTALLRARWGLNELLPDHNYTDVHHPKNRKDHRHHAIDAFVAAVTTRSTLQDVATAARRAEDKELGRLLDDLDDPWPGFREQLREALDRTVVSHRPDHGTEGRLHEETAYGLVRDPEREGANLVFRKPLIALNENEIEHIRDRDLRARLRDHVHDARGAGMALKDALARFGEETGVRRVRLLKPEADVIAIRDRDGAPYKAVIPGKNHHIDIFEQPDGTWVYETVTVFDANRGVGDRRNSAHPAARRVMRLHKGDLLRLERYGSERFMRVVSLRAKKKQLKLVEHNDAGDYEKRHKDANDPFRWDFAAISKLKERRARRVHVDEIGRVRDPGPPR